MNFVFLGDIFLSLLEFFICMYLYSFLFFLLKDDCLILKFIFFISFVLNLLDWLNFFFK